MKIKFEKKVKKKLEEANKRQKVRLGYMSSVESFLTKVEQACKYYGITKDKMEGLEVSFDENGRKFPSAYKWLPYSTIFKCRYEKGGWVVEPAREVCQMVIYYFNKTIPNFDKLFDVWEWIELKDKRIKELKSELEYWQNAYREARERIFQF